MSQKSRANALRWWRELSEEKRISLAEEHMPGREFVVVRSSSGMIERVLSKESEKLVRAISKK